jgi:hypothetical protein
LTSASASNPPPPPKALPKYHKLTEDIIHIHSGMTSASIPKPPEPSKLGDRIDRIFCFCLGHKTSYASAATLNFSSADLSPGFLSG